MSFISGFVTGIFILWFLAVVFIPKAQSATASLLKSLIKAITKLFDMR